MVRESAQRLIKNSSAIDFVVFFNFVNPLLKADKFIRFWFDSGFKF